MIDLDLDGRPELLPRSLNNFSPNMNCCPRSNLAVRHCTVATELRGSHRARRCVASIAVGLCLLSVKQQMLLSNLHASPCYLTVQLSM